MKTELQLKLIQAVKLLNEVRALAEANGKLYREQRSENLALARGFENIAGALRSNYSTSIDSIANMAAMQTPLLTNEGDVALYEKEIALTFRHQPSVIEMLNEEFGHDVLAQFRTVR